MDGLVKQRNRKGKCQGNPHEGQSLLQFLQLQNGKTHKDLLRGSKGDSL